MNEHLVSKRMIGGRKTRALKNQFLTRVQASTCERSGPHSVYKRLKWRFTSLICRKPPSQL